MPGSKVSLCPTRSVRRQQALLHQPEHPQAAAHLCAARGLPRFAVGWFCLFTEPGRTGNVVQETAVRMQEVTLKFWLLKQKPVQGLYRMAMGVCSHSSPKDLPVSQPPGHRTSPPARGSPMLGLSPSHVKRWQPHETPHCVWKCGVACHLLTHAHAVTLRRTHDARREFLAERPVLTTG